MKVIDLLNIWVEDRDKLPEKIKIEDKIFEFDKGCNLYKVPDEDSFLIQNYLTCAEMLYKEVEVIEENKEIEELEINEYRICKVMGRKCLFHQWIKKNDIFKNEYLLGIIEFEDGHLEEVPVNNIIFDDNKIEEYYFKEREEK